MMIRRALAVIVLSLAFAEPALAAAGTAVAKIAIAVPDHASVGQVAQVQARLTDASGAPIANALIQFTASLSFLQAQSDDVVLAEAKTDKTGSAVATVDLRTDGALEIAAVFQGDDRYAPARATAPITVTPAGQLYEQQAGVKVPGINSAPAVPGGAPSAGLVQSLARLWPALSGWPIALALMVIWSLYGAVVVLLFRIVGAARSADER